jgi:FMN phosphatase YigB (HAD superfamily)
MKTAICTLASISPYSQSKYVQEPKLNKELHGDYEKRTWRKKLHVDEKTGEVYIPPMAFANCIKEAAKYLSIKIPGEGQAKYTKHFEAGVMVVDRLNLGIPASHVLDEVLFVPSDGKRGGSKRVLKTFPLIDRWDGVVTFHILDDKITEDIFDKVLREAGQLIGIGRFRPRNCGYYGRFIVEDLEWIDKE